jgi:hypothetical protein
MGSGSFQGQNSLFRRCLGVFVEFLSGWRALVQKNRGFCETWGFSGIFDSL